jgi:hypothetical protein
MDATKGISLLRSASLMTCSLRKSKTYRAEAYSLAWHAHVNSNDRRDSQPWALDIALPLE